MVQSAIYCYLADKGQASYKVTKELAGEIIEFYQKSYPTDTKLPAADSVMGIMKKMYKAKDKNYIRHELRTNESDIFKMVSSDYK